MKTMTANQVAENRQLVGVVHMLQEALDEATTGIVYGQSMAHDLLMKGGALEVLPGAFQVRLEPPPRYNMWTSSPPISSAHLTPMTIVARSWTSQVRI